MHLYDIVPEDVVSVLENPEKVTPALKDRYNAFRKLGERYLRVTYKETEERYIVVTVTPKRRFEEGP